MITKKNLTMLGAFLIYAHQAISIEDTGQLKPVFTKSKSTNQKLEGKNRFASIPNGRIFIFSGQSYQIRTDLIATESKEVVFQSSEIVRNLNPFVILNHNSKQLLNRLKSLQLQPLKVAENFQTGRLGVVTGTMVVTLVPSTNIENFVKDSKWEIGSLAPQIHTLFLKVITEEDPLLQIEEIKKDRRVKSAELEVIENLARAQ